MNEITRDDALKTFLAADEAWMTAVDELQIASRNETAARNRETEAFKRRQAAEEAFTAAFKIGAKQ